MDQASNLRNIIKLQNQRIIENARIITVTSGKGGVGKSNMAVNLALCLTERGKRVIILDADFGLANVEVMFGTVPKYNLSDVLYGQMKIKDIVTRTANGIGFVSGGSGVTKLNNLDPSQIHRITTNLSQLEELCDVLIIDTGAGVSDAVMDFVISSPEILLVTTPEPSSITDSYSLLKAFYKHPSYPMVDSRIYLVANKVNTEIEGRAVYDKINQVVDKFLGGHVEYLGMVPNDPVLEKCVRSQQIVSLTAPTSKSAKAFRDITGKLLANENKNKRINGISKFFSSFMRRVQS